MKLLDFRMPPVARVTYAGDSIKQKWEEKVKNARELYRVLEYESVKHGLRKATTYHVSGSDDFAAVSLKFAREGIILQPIRRVGSYSGFSHYHPPYREGKPYTYFCSLARTREDALSFAENSLISNHDELGKLLGYPECCIQAFNERWANGYIDPIWQQAESTSLQYVKRSNENLIKFKPDLPWQTSNDMRYIGVKIIPHIPCSCDCEESIRVGKEWEQLAIDLGYESEMDDLRELLSLPREWNALKGIGYITTPVFKIETNTVTCYPNYVVQREGSFFPEEAPNGLKFPFTEKWKYHGLENCKSH
jgi:hypothetical protein